MLHVSQVLYKKEQSDAIKEGRPLKDFGEFVGHLNQHIYNNSTFAGKVHDNIVKILLKTQLVVEQKYAIIGGGDKIEQAKGAEGKEQQVAKTRDHTELPTHPERSEEPSQTKDKLDVKLQKIIRDNPEITQKIEENGGYENLKRQLVKVAIATNQQQSDPEDSGWWYGIKELFGISEAEASSVARRGIGLLGSAEIGKDEPVVSPEFSRILANPKEEAIKWLVEHMDSGMLLTTLIILNAPPINELNISSDFEKRKHDTGKAPPATTDYQKVKEKGGKIATGFAPDPGDLEPEEDEKNKEHNSFDPSKEGNHDKVSRDTKLGKLYRDAKNDKIWYSKERSGDRVHSGEHWKQFIEKGGELIHEADVDMTGKIMNKHKSTIGIKIKIKDLIRIK